jgi:hypothetical protein
MKLRFACLAVGLLSVALPLVQVTLAQTPTAAASALPRLVRFGGTVKDLNGNPLTGVVGITFALYSEQSGGAALWMETQNVSADTSGHYVALLGSTKPDGLPVELFTSEEARWVGVQVSGQAEQARVLLVSAPYALKAGDAETVGGLPPSAFVLAAPPVTGSAAASNPAASTTAASAAPATATDVTTTGGTADFLPIFNGASTVIDSVVFQAGTGATAKVGIGTTTPAATLDVKGAANVEGLLTLPATGVATMSAGKNSEPQDLVASSFSSTTSAAVNQTFQWKAEAAGNNSTTPSGTLNLLFGSGTTAPAETGLRLNNKGLFTFVTGQTFPGTGTGTITGITTPSSSGLTGGGTSGTLNLGLKTCSANQVLEFVSSAWNCANAGTGTVTSITAGLGLSGGTITSSGTLSINTAVVPQLGAANTFSGNQTITGNLSDTGNISSSGSITGQTGSFSGSSAAQILSVTQSGVGNAISATSTTTGVYGSGNYGVEGESVAASGTGVYGLATGTSGTGVLGSETANSGTTYGVLGSSSSPSGYGVYGIGGFEGVYGVGGSYGVEGTSVAASGTGVAGTATGTSGVGVLGVEEATTGTNYGVYGQNSSQSGAGVQGYALNSGGIGVNGVSAMVPGAGVLGQSPGLALSGTGLDEQVNVARGVWGDTAAPAGSGFGVLATADDNEALYAENNGSAWPTLAAVNNTTTAGASVFVAGSTYLKSSAAFGDPGCGIGFMALLLGENDMSGCNNYTLMGDNDGATYLNAVTGGTIHLRINNTDELTVTSGNVDVLGTLSKGGGSFKIDHPLDPANKYLYHSFVESPDMKNMYDGNITTDDAGLATVTLPDWFETLNRDFRYQLTVIGQFAQAIVASEISGSQFSIRTDKPNVKVSWQVTGTRQDAFANAHRIQVEVEKAPADRGHYLYPELYGAPETARIGYMAVPPGSEQIVHKRREMPRRSSTSPLPQRTLPRIPVPPRLAPPSVAPPPHPVAQLGNPEPNRK